MANKQGVINWLSEYQDKDKINSAETSKKGVAFANEIQKDKGFAQVPLTNIRAWISSISTSRQLITDAKNNKQYFLIKRAGAHGYFFQPIAEEPPSELTQASPQQARGATGKPAKTTEPKESPEPELLEEKFRALLYYNDEEYSEDEESAYPFLLQHQAATRTKEGGMQKWRYPDLIRVIWDLSLIEREEQTARFDKDLVEIKSALGERMFTVESWELKVSADRATYRQHFFQALSNSSWAHMPVLAFAQSIEDEEVAKDLATLGNFYGVKVLTFELTATQLKQCCNAETVYGLLPTSNGPSKTKTSMPTGMASCLETMEQKRTLAPGRLRESVDWSQLAAMQHDHLKVLTTVVRDCISKGRPISFISGARTINTDDQNPNASVCGDYLALFNKKAQ